SEALATCYAMAENVFAVSQGGIDGPVVVDTVDADRLETSRRAEPAIPASRRVLEMVSAGQPLPNCQIRVVGDDGRALGEREVGELALQSNCMLSGYYHRPDATREALRDGWFLTGDLGYLAGGQVYITGRKKDLIIVGGKNIYPQDVEYLINKVSGVYPGRVVVFGIPNPQLGTEDIAAVVEVDPHAPTPGDQLQLRIRQAVATGMEATLTHVLLVNERSLIKTSSGKLSRKANRDKFLADMQGGE
ncbi:MAG: acyl-phosphate glycerol 3-phosphate acyltransferase, partial [Anaerolineales bacterium]